MLQHDKFDICTEEGRHELYRIVANLSARLETAHPGVITRGYFGRHIQSIRNPVIITKACCHYFELFAAFDDDARLLYMVLRASALGVQQIEAIRQALLSSANASGMELVRGAARVLIREAAVLLPRSVPSEPEMTDDDVS